MSIAVFTSFDQLCDQNGDPMSGATVTVYQAGTTTPLALFSDDSLSVAAANPIVCDGYGRHDMRYFAATAYKVVVKNSDGVTQYTRDDVDPSVPLGTGVLAIANGGTGADNAAAALANLGAVDQNTVTDLAAQVASLAGSLGSVERTHIATGTNDQRPDDPIFGDIRANIDLEVPEAWDEQASAWKRFALEGRLNHEYFKTNSIAFPLQTVRAVTSANTAISASIPIDASVPQIGEGTQVFSQSFTPRSASSKIRFEAKIRGQIPGAARIAVALFQNSDANAIAATYQSLDTASANFGVVDFRAEVNSSSTSARTYSIRVGTSGGTFTLNNGSDNLGGLMESDLIITEILAV